MSDADQLRGEYLARLDAAMRELPHGVAVEIRGGIVEELTGLDAEATAARIEQLGDPAVIAREARAEVPAVDGVSVVVAAPVIPAPKGPVSATRGFAIVAALTLGFGGFVVPVVGWIAGIALVVISPLWRAWEKIVAIAVPLIGLAAGLLANIGASSSSNPLSLGGVHSAIISAIMLVPVGALWLLWRLRGRAAS